MHKNKLPFLRTHTRLAGFTLVEMLLYMGLLAIFLVTLTSMITTLASTQLDSVSTSTIDQSAQYLFGRFDHDVGQATAIVLPSAEGVASDTLVLSIDGEQRQYAVVDGNMLLTTPLGSERLNPDATAVESISFLRLGNAGGMPTITISLELQSTVIETAGVESRSLQYTIGLR